MEEKKNEITMDTPTAEEAKQGAEAVEAAKPEKVPKIDFAAIARDVQAGKLELAEPITYRDFEYTELEYNFGALKGIELAQALDFGSGRKDSFSLTDVQALNLFAAAAAKCQKGGGLDATDIRTMIGGMDAIKAIQLASLFFSASSRAGNQRISKK